MDTSFPSFSLNNFSSLFRRGDISGIRQFATANYQSQTRTGVSIVTAEGDRVTLTSQSTFQGRGVGYTAKGVANGQAVQLRGKAIDAQFSRQQQVVVEGDLNEQEIQDIRNVLKTVTALKKDVASGNLQGAIAKGSRVEASGSLASVGVRVELSQTSSSVSRITQTRRQPLVPRVPNVGEPQGNRTVQPNHVRIASTEPAETLARGVKKVQGKVKQDQSFNTSSDALEHSFSRPLANGVRGFGKLLERATDKIVNGVEKIGKLAERLEGKVEKQANKIANIFQKIGKLAANGKGDHEKADKLRGKLEHHLDKLGQVVEKLTSKIQDQADKIGKVLDNVNARIAERFNPNPSVNQARPSGENVDDSVNQEAQQKDRDVAA